MQIKGDSYSVFYDPEKNTIDIFGSIRLRGTEQYKAILDLLLSALEQSSEAGLILNVTNLDYLNSSGINTIGKFIIHARDKNIGSLKILGNNSIQWQRKTLQNLQRLWTKLSLEIN